MCVCVLARPRSNKELTYLFRLTQLLNLACCLPLLPDDIEIAKLRQSVAVARQHHQQLQVPAASDVIEPGQHDEPLSCEETRPLNGCATVPSRDPQSTDGESLHSSYIEQYISETNSDYDHQRRAHS